jgi:hypothetical protein
MNAKKCKQLRQSLRRSGVDWREKEYKVEGMTRFFTGHVTLEQSCGRAKYKWVKQVAV